MLTIVNIVATDYSLHSYLGWIKVYVENAKFFPHQIFYRADPLHHWNADNRIIAWGVFRGL